MDYDVERSKQASEEIRKAFREIFPLANEHDLPWAACHIKGFLKGRIEMEVKEGMSLFESRVVRVLCEISPPKTHVEDMARIVVEEAKLFRQNKQKLIDFEELAVALKESVNLQSHYAELLNGYDAGTRAKFPTAKAWIDRLREVRTIKKEEP